jgi:hypothetical protein
MAWRIEAVPSSFSALSKNGATSRIFGELPVTRASAACDDRLGCERWLLAHESRAGAKDAIGILFEDMPRVKI